MSEIMFVLAKPKAGKGLRRSIHRWNRGPVSHTLLGLAAIAMMPVVVLNEEIGARLFVGLIISISLRQFMFEMSRRLRIRRALKNDHAIEIEMMFARLWLAKLESYDLSDHANESLDWLTSNPNLFMEFIDAIHAWKKSHNPDTSYVRHQVNQGVDMALQVELDAFVHAFATRHDNS